MAKLINVGFGNVVNSRKIVAVVSPDAAPVKRMIQSVKGTRTLIDATQGRKTKAVIVTSDDYLVLSALQPETIARRFSEAYGEEMREEGNPRPGEKDGEAYFFRTKEEFEQLILEDGLIEYAQYVENYYGTPRKYVEEQLSAGKDVILEIEIQGAMKIREKFPDTLLVFVCPPSMEELKNRLVGRGTETLDVINGRLRRAVEESRGMDKYDYLLINDDLEECVDTLHETIRCERMRTSRNHDFVSRIQKEAEAFL